MTGDDPSHARAMFEIFIGGVDNRIRCFRGDIAPYQLEVRI